MWLSEPFGSEALAKRNGFFGVSRLTPTGLPRQTVRAMLGSPKKPAVIARHLSLVISCMARGKRDARSALSSSAPLPGGDFLPPAVRDEGRNEPNEQRSMRLSADDYCELRNAVSEAD